MARNHEAPRQQAGTTATGDSPPDGGTAGTDPTRPRPTDPEANGFGAARAREDDGEDGPAQGRDDDQVDDLDGEGDGDDRDAAFEDEDEDDDLDEDDEDDEDQDGDAGTGGQSPLPRVAGLAAVLLLGVVLGLVVGVANGRSDAAPPGDASAEAGFARDMIVHHQQAVTMSEFLRGHTTDPDLLPMAVDIAGTQQAQMGQLWGWLEAWGLEPGSDEPPMAWMGHAGGPMPGMATGEQLEQLTEARGRTAEILFAQRMIPHHEGGVAMAEAILARTERPEVRRFAQQTIESQRSEIDSLQSWLRRHGAERDTTPPDPAGGGGHSHP